MDIINKHNIENIIGKIKDCFNSNKNKNEKIEKKSVYKIFFENSIIDILDFDIFNMKSILDKISPESEEIDYLEFENFLLFLYYQQIKKTRNIDLDIDLHSISRENRDQILMKDIYENSPNFLQHLIKKLSNKEREKFDFCFPDFTDQRFQNLISPENLSIIEKYSASLRELFDKNLNINIKKELRISAINLYELVQIIKILTNPYKSETLSTCLLVFFNNSEFNLQNKKDQIQQKNDTLEDEKYNSNDEKGEKFDSTDNFELYKQVENIIRIILDTPKIRDDKIQFEDTLFKDESSLRLEKINFSFSTFSLMLAYFGFFFDFKEEENIIDDKTRINHIFEVLEISPRQEDNYKYVLTERKEEIPEEEEFLPSRRLEDAMIQQQTKEFTQDDNNFLVETLAILDKELNDNYINLIKQTQNPVNLTNYNNFPISHVFNKNNVSSENYDKPFLFPNKELKIEILEKAKAKEEERNRILVEKARKPDKKNDKKGPPKFPPVWEEKYDKEKQTIKYQGNPSIEDMKHRFFKISYKDTIVNTTVYPSLLREVMVIPRSLTREIAEYVLLCYKYQTEGKFDVAISVMEKVKELHLDRLKDMDQKVREKQLQELYQVDLFIHVNLGNMYESLSLYMQALRYYMDSKNYAEKLDSLSPDSAIAYANLGACFYHIREPEWAFKCFWKAKEIRENLLGGDCLDTATIYNNLGCSLYCMQNYYAGYGFFKLAFEIYHKILGTLHSRTILIRGNLDKLNQMNFSKPFQIKSAGYFPAYTFEKETKKKTGKK